MRDLSSLLASRAGKLALSLLLAPPIIPASAFTFASIPDPNLNLQDLGRVAFTGDFDAISLYQYEGQTEQSSGLNAVFLSQLPNGVFAKVQDTDGDVKAMCAYEKDGNLQGIVVGGNFTSVDSKHTPGGIAMLNATDGSVKPLEGLNGSVNALHCDSDRGQVYVGGSFTGGNSTNAIIWKGDWNNMPFQGFNGPVNSIVQGPNDTIVFGGVFNGLGGNSTGTTQNNTQAIPIGSANITAQTSSGRPGLTDPKKIVCKSDSTTEGSDNTWLLSDNAPGFWKADFGFGFQPTKLTLYNTKLEGRGTKTWRYTALPDGGIMNFSYVDPSTKQQRYCDATCPLPEGNTTGQEFTFVNTVGMNAFRLDISDWYGSGGGLNGIELSQNDIYSFAIDEFNAPTCGGGTTGASATKTGPWLVTPSHDSNAQYLTATLDTENIDPNKTFVVFEPDIPQTGNYSVMIYTPGCRGDGTCGTRGRVNISWNMFDSSSTTEADAPTSTTLFQTNEFDKYDTVYKGFVDTSSGFKPSVTLSPVVGQNPGTNVLTVVAQRVRWMVDSTSSDDLNGLFEYDPDKQEVKSEDFTKSTVDTAGKSLSPKSAAIVTTMATANDQLYVGGNFSSGEGLNNIFAISKSAKGPTTLQGNGLNSQVMTVYGNGSTVYVGGNFTNTQDKSASGLNGVAAYNNDKWQALGAGVNGVVMYIIPISMNITANSPEDVLAISGFFDQVNSFDKNAAFSVDNFAVWVPSKKNWLHNLNLQTPSIQGRLMSFVNIPNSARLFAGAVSSQALGASGSAALEYGNGLSLEGFPLSIQAGKQQTSLRKRSLTEGQNLTTTGIVTATFYMEEGMNKTILAGHFALTGSDGENITNVAVIDGKDSDKVSGFGDEVDANSTFAAVGVLDHILFAGGVVSGEISDNNIAGVVAYDLSTNKFAGTQPPGLQGINITVNAIAPRPKSKDVYVAGRFESAGALSCPSLCIWNTERNQWTSPGGDISGVVTSLFWISDTKVLVSGNLTVENNQTTLATYDSSTRQYQALSGANDLPGPVTAFCQANADGSEVWAAGQSSDGSAFLQRFDGSKWLAVKDQFQPGTTIRGLQVLTVSEDHGDSDLIDNGQDLLILGQVNITNFGTASAALFNGTALIPFLLSSTSDGASGSLSQVFVENQSFFNSGGKHLALGFIVLIALGIALALTFLLVVAGILVEYFRKKAQGYSPAPQSYTDRMGNVGRVPPEQLFGTLSGPRPPAI